MAGRPTPRRGAALTVLAVLVCASCGSDAEQSTSPDPRVIKDGELTVCTSLPYEPFAFEKNGEIIGFEVDLVGKVAAELDLDPVVLNEDFDAVQSGELLNDGKCDMVAAGLTITGDRARVLDFSTPYFNAAQTMVVQQGSGIGSLEDLGRGRVAVQKGTTGELLVTDNAPASAQIVTFDDVADIDTALSGGTVDAGVYDNTIAGDVVKRNDQLEIAAQFDTGEQYGMAVKKEGNVDLLRVVNQVIADLEADGGYDKIYAKWFGKAPQG